MEKQDKNKGCFFCKHIVISGGIDLKGIENPFCCPETEKEFHPLQGYVFSKYNCLLKNKDGYCKYFCDSGKNAVHEHIKDLKKIRNMLDGME